ncbi:MAG: glycogen/starch synthase [Gammaproteobacteria bacterium]|jgi:starch synthase
MTHVLMVAAENGALPGGKVGGIGDVLREVPAALAKSGCEVSVVTPAYGVFGKLAGAKRIKTLTVRFGGSPQALELFRLPAAGNGKKVHQYAIEHPLFSSCGAGRIYCDDGPGRPFETDASKFALFCLAVAEAIAKDHFGTVDILHLHDWHAAFLLILRRYDPRYELLANIRCVYSIHNLEVQGIRPFEKHISALEAWYPELKYERKQLADPRWPDCVNPTASAIRLADAVHTVSPTYAEEILRPGDPGKGIHGGEGLHQELRAASKEKRLFGILNGCVYPRKSSAIAEDWATLVEHMRLLVMRWGSRADNLASAHFIALESLARLPAERPAMLVTSVGRVTSQKVELMRTRTSDGKPALHAALESLDGQGVMLMVGSGDHEYERFLAETMVDHANFIFLRGYSDVMAGSFYRQGDLFFMPSSFEPCGISQMLALRAGQPCLVHHVGGLRDTVDDGRTGFAFDGNTLTGQADALVATMQRALSQYRDQPAKWQEMSKAAAKARFTWADSIDAYKKKLYRIA